MKRKYIIILVLMFSLLTPLFVQKISKPVFALSQKENEIYLVYDEMGNVIFESNFVEVGDRIITKNFDEFEVTSVNEKTQSAYADYIGRFRAPKIKRHANEPSTFKAQKKSVALYITHNDESYVPTDKTESVYGKGGIHDVAKEFGRDFENLGYTVSFDETLHIPHDRNAYKRSEKTAQKLLKNSPNAIFDIHRDGVPRSVYVKKYDGVERCKVRIVVGQANPKKDENLQFALYLLSVAKEYCPWLFLDIYYAKGHYNQALSNKALLFEMGSHLCEKEIVLRSMPYLANVVDKTLFKTIVEDEDNIILEENPTEEESDKLVNNMLDKVSAQNKFLSKGQINAIIFSSIFVVAMIVLASVLIVKHKKQIKKTKANVKK